MSQNSTKLIKNHCNRAICSLNQQNKSSKASTKDFITRKRQSITVKHSDLVLSRYQMDHMHTMPYNTVVSTDSIIQKTWMYIFTSCHCQYLQWSWQCQHWLQTFESRLYSVDLNCNWIFIMYFVTMEEIKMMVYIVLLMYNVQLFNCFTN